MESIPENLESLLRSLIDDSLKENKNSRKVRHSSAQVMRLLLNARRTEQGYRGAEVLVGPSRTEEAYVAAVLALLPLCLGDLPIHCLNQQVKTFHPA